jgi:hypothetical protein
MNEFASEPCRTGRELLERYPSREMKLTRIKALERAIEKMESEDEAFDPVLIEGHIRMNRGVRAGCGVLMLCAALMSFSVAGDGHKWAVYLAVTLTLLGAINILRGLLFKPDPKAIRENYKPKRGTRDYREKVQELGELAQALSQDLEAEDAV